MKLFICVEKSSFIGFSIKWNVEKTVYTAKTVALLIPEIYIGYQGQVGASKKPPTNNHKGGKIYGKSNSG